MVIIKDKSAKSINLNLKCLGMSLAIHKPKAIESAPMNNPILVGETPSQRAIPAAIPAPIVQSGQCAEAKFGQAKKTKTRVA